MGMALVNNNCRISLMHCLSVYMSDSFPSFGDHLLVCTSRVSDQSHQSSHKASHTSHSSNKLSLTPAVSPVCRNRQCYNYCTNHKTPLPSQHDSSTVTIMDRETQTWWDHHSRTRMHDATATAWNIMLTSKHSTCYSHSIPYRINLVSISKTFTLTSWNCTA